MIDETELKPMESDFRAAMQKIVPSSVRSDTSAAYPLSGRAAPLLDAQFGELLRFVATNWPQVVLKHEKLCGEAVEAKKRLFGDVGERGWDSKSIFKPRLLITGPHDNAQNQIAGALLDAMDHIKIIKITLASLYSNQNRTVEDALGENIREASRAGRAILYIPGLTSPFHNQFFQPFPNQFWKLLFHWFVSDVVALWDGLSDSSQRILLAILKAIPAEQPTFLIATSTLDVALPSELKKLFDRPWKDKFNVQIPTEEQRTAFFLEVKESCLKVIFLLNY